MNEYILSLLSILETIPRDILINCAEQILFKKDDLDQEMNVLIDRLKNSDPENIDSIMKRIKEIKEIKNDPRCISACKVKLGEHQLKAIRFINDPKNDSLLVVHGTGTGKTLTSLTASQCYLERNPDSTVFVISPASLIGNFEKEMIKYGGKISDRYKFYSFHKFTSLNNNAFVTPFDIFYNDNLDTYQDKNPDKDSGEIRHMMIKFFNENIKIKLVGGKGMKFLKDDLVYTMYKKRADEINYKNTFDCRNSMVIIDEAHNFRNMGAHYKSMFGSIIKAKKLLLLTATPFVNKLHDFTPLINLVHRDDKILKKLYKNIPDEKIKMDDPAYYKNLDIVSKALKGKVSYYDEKSTEFFPVVKMHDIKTYMSRDFFDKYEKELDTGFFGDIPELYYNGFRRAVNAVGVEEYLNKKIDDALEIIKNGKQTLIFTNWLEDGVEILKNVFEKNSIQYLAITGKVLPRLRLGIVESYNSKSVQVLIISIAGSEGLDLRETQNVIILDPVFSKATLDQIIGRAVRYKSHVRLPIDQHYVDVYKLILAVPPGKLPSGDELLYSIIREKTEISNDIDKLLKNISI